MVPVSACIRWNPFTLMALMPPNKYTIQKARWEEQVRRVKEEEQEIVSAWKVYKVRLKYILGVLSLIDLFEEEKQSLRKAQPQSMLRCCMEVLLILTLLLTIPFTILAFEIIFYLGTWYIHPDIIGRFWDGTQNMTARG